MIRSFGPIKLAYGIGTRSSSSWVQFSTTVMPALERAGVSMPPGGTSARNRWPSGEMSWMLSLPETSSPLCTLRIIEDIASAC